MDHIALYTFGFGCLGGAGATAFWWPILWKRDREIQSLRASRDSLATNWARAFMERNAAIRDHQALKAKYDQPRVGGKFAKKREGV